MIKLFASDLDGTLLKTGDVLPEKTREVLRRLTDEGKYFVAATGRDYTGIYPLFEEAKVPFSAILGNGAQYRDLNGELTIAEYFPHDKFKAVIEPLLKRNIRFMIFAADGFYSVQEPQDVFEQFMIRSTHRFNISKEQFLERAKRTKMPCTQLQKIEDIDAFLASDVEIIKVEAFNWDPTPVVEAKEELALIEGISYLSSFNDNVEVTAPKAQKGLILKEVIQLLGIQEDEVAVFGDGMNDISLFTEFKNSYAPSNAVNEIKALAKEVILSNVEEGVAYKIEALLDED